jgi:hypothetical protein
LQEFFTRWEKKSEGGFSGCRVGDLQDRPLPSILATSHR